MMNAYYDAAKKAGVKILYEAEVVDFEIADGEFRSASVIIEGKPAKVNAKTLIAASGGFESNIQWLKEAWGPMADNFLIRGTPYNKGTVLKRLLALGAESISDSKEGHMVAIDGRSPKFDG
jgi:tricarballylate dehydrogenase